MGSCLLTSPQYLLTICGDYIPVLSFKLVLLIRSNQKKEKKKIYAALQGLEGKSTLKILFEKERLLMEDYKSAGQTEYL